MEQGFRTHFNLTTTGFQVIHKAIQSVQTNTGVVWPAVSLLKKRESTEDPYSEEWKEENIIEITHQYCTHNAKANQFVL